LENQVEGRKATVHSHMDYTENHTSTKSGVSKVVNRHPNEEFPHRYLNCSPVATNNRNARGIIYVRREVRDVGREVELVEMNEQDMRLIRELVNEFSAHFGFNAEKK